MPVSEKPAIKNPVLFEVQLNLLPDGRGILTAKDVKGTVYVSAPPEFGGPENNWSPEHLLLCALSSCFLTTFQFFAKDLTVEEIQCDCIGKVQLVEGSYRFTQIDLFPKITLVQPTDTRQAQRVLQLTQKHCLVAHSLNCDLVYHNQLLTGKPE